MKLSLPGSGRRENTSGSAQAPPERPFLEIQYHPGDIRRKVRYRFLSRRQVTYGVLGLLALVAFLVYSVAILPAALGELMAAQRYEDLVAERSALGARLKQSLATLEALEEESEEVGLRMAKIYLAYGFSYDQLEGQGGYPFEAEEVPASIFSADVRRGNGARARISEQLAVLEVFLHEVATFEEDYRSRVRQTPSIMPLRGSDFVLTSPYGRRRNPFTKQSQNHAGIDLAAATGTPIYATADGVVTYAGWYSLKQSAAWWRYGRLVAIHHGDRFITIYGHCDEIKVERGQRVKQGDVIATVGNTGWSTSPHLHYEVRRLDDTGEEYRPVDPRIYILDHRWRDEERILVRARNAPEAKDFEPLPRRIRR